MKIIDKTATIYEPVVFVETAGHEYILEKNCVVGQFGFIGARKLHMLEGAIISPQATIGGGGDVELREFSLIGFGAKLFPATDTAEGRYMVDSKPESERAVIRGSITVGEGAYIGANAIVCVSKKCPNIHIGDFTVIGANSYVDRDIPANIVMHPWYGTRLSRLMRIERNIK